MPPGEQRLVVQDVDFALKAGNGLGVIGPSASGKSSLARALVGVWLPARGKVRLDGAALDQWSSEALGRHIGYLPQDVELFDGHRRPEHRPLRPAGRPRGHRHGGPCRRRPRPHRRLAAMAMRPDRRAWRGALGRPAAAVALARALYGDPFLVVLDEPDSNLDAEGEQALKQAILGVRQRGGIVVVVAHRSSVLAGVDLLLAMHRGRPIAMGPKDAVLQKLRPPGPPPEPL